MTPRPTRDEIPLNVQVAMALGCKPYRGGFGGEEWCCPCGDNSNPGHGKPETLDGDGSWYVIWPYGEDSPEGWAVTGPLMSKYRIEVVPYVHVGGNWWAAWMDPNERIIAGSGESRAEFYERAQIQGPEAPSAPAAICALILALSEAGRLTEKD